MFNLTERFDPILKTPTEIFEFSKPPTDPVILAERLKETMLKMGGLGLAAPQVGLPYRVFVFGEAENVMEVFNPRIVDASDEQIYMIEGCLTFPNLFINIRRPEGVRVRFQRMDGETHTMTFGGVSARVFQHEADHLDGILYQTRATRYHLEKATKELALFTRRNQRRATNSPT